MTTKHNILRMIKMNAGYGDHDDDHADDDHAVVAARKRDVLNDPFRERMEGMLHKKKKDLFVLSSLKPIVGCILDEAIQVAGNTTL